MRSACGETNAPGLSELTVLVTQHDRQAIIFNTADAAAAAAAESGHRSPNITASFTVQSTSASRNKKKYFSECITKSPVKFSFNC